MAWFDSLCQSISCRALPYRGCAVQGISVFESVLHNRLQQNDPSVIHVISAASTFTPAYLETCYQSHGLKKLWIRFPPHAPLSLLFEQPSQEVASCSSHMFSESKRTHLF